MISHIILHVALCKAMAQQPPQTTFAMHVLLTANPQRDPQLDQTFTVERGMGNEVKMTFDIGQGGYGMLVTVPKFPACVDRDFVAVLPNLDRDVHTRLYDDPSQLPIAPAVVSGNSSNAPQYANPTIVLLDGKVTCNGDVGDPLDENIDNLAEPDAYYAKIYSQAAITNRASRIAALRLTDTGGGFHYIRVRLDFPKSTTGWAAFSTFNIDIDAIQLITGKPEDTLLCPRLTKTSVG